MIPSYPSAHYAIYPPPIQLSDILHYIILLEFSLLLYVPFVNHMRLELQFYASAGQGEQNLASLSKE